MTRPVSEQVVVRFVASCMVPFIQLYGIYVIMHGESGPGGGFQGGVILGASVILYALAFGSRAGRLMVSRAAGDRLMAVGVAIYAGIGLLALVRGGNYLEHDRLPLPDPLAASHLGILGIEIGVGITVAAVMVTIFFATARERDD